MKSSELRRLVARYADLRRRHERLPSARLADELAGMEHRYYHETGRTLKSHLEGAKKS